MINASSLVLLNPGSVHTRGVVTAISIGRLSDGTLVVDPDEEEEESLGGGGCFALMFAILLKLWNEPGLQTYALNYQEPAAELKQMRPMRVAFIHPDLGIGA